METRNCFNKCCYIEHSEATLKGFEDSRSQGFKCINPQSADINRKII
jgi:hypothetical protein